VDGDLHSVTRPSDAVNRQAKGATVAPRINLTSVMVNDQTRALTFYTDVLGFEKKMDLPVGGDFRWITVVSPEGHDDVQLALEPVGYDFAKTFQQQLYDSGIPATAFAVADINAEYERMTGLGVVFRGEPAQAGPVTIAIFEDTCGNLIQLYQMHG
jgi:catechol 2,3-dioxygenase-like lactoylglutathione lyase family enzyme